MAPGIDLYAAPFIPEHTQYAHQSGYHSLVTQKWHYEEKVGGLSSDTESGAGNILEFWKQILYNEF